MKDYDHKKIEKKWQDEWGKSGIYNASDSLTSKKFYGLIEFPFPSGSGMHVGHLRSNTAMDIIARKRRSEGFNVLYPIGWDAFGLPTENYAIKTGKQPALVTKENTDNFRRQLKSAGFSFDWSREINTTDPAYYKWTQWIFLQFVKKGLAYKKKMLINWCPKDKIGLANEEVVDGKCERCGTVVEKREKEQWMLAITKYADRLDADLDSVDYAEKIKIQQRNWIGKSEGAEIEFKLRVEAKLPNSGGSLASTETIKVFTTRPDTLFGVTYMVIAPEHELVQTLKSQISNWSEVETYITSARNKEEIERTAENKEKTGVELKGIKAINPATKEEIPVYIADYVVAHYGTGAIMAVPAHDERDFAFATKYKLPIKDVVIPKRIDHKNPPQEGKEVVFRNAVICLIKNPATDKYLLLKWKQQPWTTFVMGGVEDGEDVVEAALREIHEETGYKNVKFIKKLGAPTHAEFYAAHKGVNRIAHTQSMYFELINDEREELSAEEAAIHDLVWVDFKEITPSIMTHIESDMILDRLVNGVKAMTERGILINSGEFNNLHSDEAMKKITEAVGGKIVTTYKLRDWVFSRQRYWGEPIPMVYCADCEKKTSNGWVPVPEKDLPVVLPEVEKYQPTDTGESPLAAIDSFVNTTCPNCGGPAKRETDTMPNWAGSSWYFLRYTDPKNNTAFASDEALKYWIPVDWYNGGMEHTTLHLLYSRFWHKFLFDLGLVPTSEPYAKRTSHGLILAADGTKFSKSKGNGVDPDTIIDLVGADTLRLYQMFMGPFEQAVSWSDDGVVGPRRFLEKVWRMQEKVVEKLPFVAHLESLIHKTIKKVTEDIESLQFNTAVSSMMILVNEMDKQPQLAKAYYEHLLKLLAPFAPHITEELWADLGHTKSIHLEPWQSYMKSKIVDENVIIVVQVNGKVRGEFSSQPGLTEDEAQKMSLNIENVKKWVDGKQIKKVIYIQGKLVNIVVA